MKLQQNELLATASRGNFLFQHCCFSSAYFERCMVHAARCNAQWI